MILAQKISRYPADGVRRMAIPDLSTEIRDVAGFFTFVAKEQDERMFSEPDLPGRSKAIFCYRYGRFGFSDDSTRIFKTMKGLFSFASKIRRSQRAVEIQGRLTEK